MRIDSRSLRVERWLARAPRIALLATAIVLSAAGIRSIAAGAMKPAPAPPRTAPRVDFGAAGFAETFARVYLSWDSDRPEHRDRLLASLTAETVDAGAGLQPPEGVNQTVTSASAVHQERRSATTIVTVAAEAGRETVYLAVPVTRDAKGLLYVPAPPAIVGPPVAPRAKRAPEQELVEHPDLVEVATRAVRNYLGRERTNLIADLADDAVVALPDAPLEVENVDGLTWIRRPNRVAVLVDARAAEGTRMSLRYELEVLRVGGRWLVRSIGTNPSSRRP